MKLRRRRSEDRHQSYTLLYYSRHPFFTGETFNTLRYCLIYPRATLVSKRKGPPSTCSLNEFSFSYQVRNYDLLRNEDTRTKPFDPRLITFLSRVWYYHVHSSVDLLLRFHPPLMPRAVEEQGWTQYCDILCFDKLETPPTNWLIDLSGVVPRLTAYHFLQNLAPTYWKPLRLLLLFSKRFDSPKNGKKWRKREKEKKMRRPNVGL
jgi:hypothetical protein